MLDTNPLIAQVDNAVRQRFNEQENNPTDSEVRAQYELFYDLLRWNTWIFRIRHRSRSDH